MKRGAGESFGIGTASVCLVGSGAGRQEHMQGCRQRSEYRNLDLHPLGFGRIPRISRQLSEKFP